MIAIIVIAFSFLCIFAVFAYVSGEIIRSDQKRKVSEYVIKKKGALIKLREIEKAREEKKEKEMKAKKVKFKLPEDKKLSEGIQLLRKTALNSPNVVANVMRMFIKGNSSIRPGEKQGKGLNKEENPRMSLR